jgi:epoxyqueuosine reductase
MSLKEKIVQTAHTLGFELIGVTTPQPPQTYAVFERWLAAGRHGEMGYLATPRSLERRADPRQILPGCRSILVLGVRYAKPDSPPGLTGKNSNPRGRVAAYAWGLDYHDVLIERLEQLHTHIEAMVEKPVPARWYTDTGPILERDVAQRAGLGWIGKNTCLIDPQSGSYFLLAEMLLELDLPPDPPFQNDFCGNCTRCLDACPTTCILPDRTLDARRCISYLTIELKEAIPLELRSQMGDWVFGCDICQQVCPWNIRFAPENGDPEFHPARHPEANASWPQPDLLTELRLTAEAFNRKFKGSPVKRAKRRGYLRNVAVALGNQAPVLSPEQSQRAITELSSVLIDDPEPLVRAHAAWALGRFPGEQVKRALQGALVTEEDENVRAEIHLALKTQPGTSG